MRMRQGIHSRSSRTAPTTKVCAGWLRTTHFCMGRGITASCCASSWETAVRPRFSRPAPLAERRGCTFSISRDRAMKQPRLCRREVCRRTRGNSGRRPQGRNAGRSPFVPLIRVVAPVIVSESGPVIVPPFKYSVPTVSGATPSTSSVPLSWPLIERLGTVSGAPPARFTAPKPVIETVEPRLVTAPVALVISNAQHSSVASVTVRRSSYNLRKRSAARRSVGGLDHPVKRDLDLPFVWLREADRDRVRGLVIEDGPDLDLLAKDHPPSLRHASKDAVKGGIAHRGRHHRLVEGNRHRG